MASRDEMIRELKRRDMIKQLQERDMAAGEAEATKLAEQKYEETKPGVIETVGLNALQGVTRNWGDEIGGKLAGLLGGNEEATKEHIQDRVKRSQVDSPKTAFASEVAGGVAATPFVANPVGMAAIAGADGVARSLGKADKLDANAAKDAALTGGIDAATAGMLAKVSPKVLEKLKQYGEPAYDKFAGFLKSTANQKAVKSLGGSQGQFQKLAASDKMDDVGNMLLEEKVVTPFASSKKIAERVNQRGEDLAAQTKPIYEAASNSKLSSDKLGKVFSDKMDELGLDPGSLPVADQLGKYKGQVNSVNRRIKDGQVKDLVERGADLPDAEMFAPGKTYNPADLRKFRQSVDAGINFNSDAVSQQGAKQARSLIREQEMGLIENIDPALRSQNEKLFRQLHLNSLAEDMAEKGAAKSGVNNALGINSWQAGQVAASVAQSGPVATAIIGARELIKRFGPQTSAVALDKISKAMQAGKFAPMFAKAAEQGPKSVAALHAALIKNPEYQAEISE
jgi:hypothetical protein